MDHNNNMAFMGVVFLGVLGLIGLFFFMNDKHPAPANPIQIQQVPVPVQPPAQAQPQPQPPTPQPNMNGRLYNAGYQDGCQGRRPDPVYHNHEAYMRGYRDGMHKCPPHLRLNINLN